MANQRFHLRPNTYKFNVPIVKLQQKNWIFITWKICLQEEEWESISHPWIPSIDFDLSLTFNIQCQAYIIQTLDIYCLEYLVSLLHVLEWRISNLASQIKLNHWSNWFPREDDKIRKETTFFYLYLYHISLAIARAIALFKPLIFLIMSS